MEIFLIFLNPKKCFEEVRDKNLLFKLIPFYFLLFIILIFYLNSFLKEKTLFFGSIIQLLFNIIFIIFVSLFIKVFIKIFGIDRKFAFAISDTLLIFIPSFVLFFFMVLFSYSYLNKFMYGLIYLFSYNNEILFKKALFFFYYPPRLLLFLYTFLGLRYLYGLSFKRSSLITLLIYFIIFIIYLL
ncbi:MAG: hypothetical protein QMD25_02220 [Caldisericia bacterium]|jgi:hypothetical protein|nr:hypothetical protein [Caldisericia bacterium]